MIVPTRNPITSTTAGASAKMTRPFQALRRQVAAELRHYRGVRSEGGKRVHTNRALREVIAYRLPPYPHVTFPHTGSFNCPCAVCRS